MIGGVTSLKIFVCASALLVLFLCFQFYQLVAFERNFEKLTPGMTKEQVTQLLGTPTTRSGSVEISGPVWKGKALSPEHGAAVVGWRYGFLLAPFQVWGVSFNKSGHVNQIYVETSP
ncbi:MAG: outer membrane protein assembly factor BamE [Candidatus Obscuribacter sp.]|nr:outer membrane protein assembly factor BamE [Candidatus Obscuribacter sp.]MDQ5968377.1 SmpA / OmlA family [Cyanobacteriota bacterium erpe_2018_sw_39hr_WHONDRS-SW48-000098_B_bin.30]